MEKVILVTSRNIDSLKKDDSFIEIVAQDAYYKQFFNNYGATDEGKTEGVWGTICVQLGEGAASLLEAIGDTFSDENYMQNELIIEELLKQENKKEIIKKILGDNKVKIKADGTDSFLPGIYKLEIIIGKDVEYRVYLAEEYPAECIISKNNFSLARQTYMDALIESVAKDISNNVENIEWTILSHDNDFGQEGNGEISQAISIPDNLTSLKKVIDGMKSGNRIFVFKHDNNYYYNHLSKKLWETIYFFVRVEEGRNMPILWEFKSQSNDFIEVLKPE